MLTNMSRYWENWVQYKHAHILRWKAYPYTDRHAKNYERHTHAHKLRKLHSQMFSHFENNKQICQHTEKSTNTTTNWEKHLNSMTNSPTYWEHSQIHWHITLKIYCPHCTKKSSQQRQQHAYILRKTKISTYEDKNKSTFKETNMPEKITYKHIHMLRQTYEIWSHIKPHLQTCPLIEKDINIHIEGEEHSPHCSHTEKDS